MADMNDLVEKLMPMMNDKAFQDELKRTVVLDIDTKDAQKEFGTVTKHLDGLKDAIKQASANAQDATSIYKNFGQVASVAISIVEEKLRKVNLNIKDTMQKLADAEKKLGAVKSGPHGVMDAKKYNERKTALEKELKAREKLADEYKREQTELNDLQNNTKQPSVPTSTASEATQPKKGGVKRFKDWAPKEVAEKIEAEERKKIASGATQPQKGGVKTPQEAVEKIEEKEKQIAGATTQPSKGGVKRFKDWAPSEVVKKIEEKEKKAIASGTYSSNYYNGLPVITPKVAPTDATGEKGEDTEEKDKIENYNQLIAKIEEVKADADALREVMKDGDSADFEEDIAELQSLERELKRLESAKKTIDSEHGAHSIGGVTPYDYSELSSAIDVYKEKIAQLSNQIQGGKSTNYEQDVKDLAQLQAELKKFESTKKAIDTGTSLQSTEQQEEQKISGLLNLIKETIKTSAELGREKTKLPFSSDIEGTQQHIKDLGSRMKELNAIWASIKSGPVVQSFSSIISAVSNIKDKLTGGAGAIKSALTGVFNVAKQGATIAANAIGKLVSGGFNALKTAATTALGNMRRLVSGGFNLLSRGVETAKKKFLSFRSHMNSIVKKSTPNLLKSLGSIKSMLMRRIKRTFISSIFNQAKEGLQQLAKHSKEFNASMSAIKNTAKQTAGNLSVTLGNMVNVIAPALQTLLGWFNKVLEAVNALFALLSGKKTVTVAKQNTDDYAKSLKSASGSAKDLNNQLYGFDEITRQESNNGGGGGGSIGYTEEAVGDMYADIANMFKEGKFREIGQQIGNILNGVVEKIDNWVIEVRSKAKEWAGNIAEILNGIVDTDLIVTAGKTIGDTINLLSDTIGTFFDTFEFDSFGKKIGDSVNHLFDAVEWDTLGNTVASVMSSLWEILSNAFAQIEWDKIGKDFADGFASFFNRLDFDAWKDMITNGLNGVISLLYNFVSNVDWDDVSKRYFETIKAVIDGINWDEIARLISEGFKSALTIMSNFVDSGTIGSLAQRLGKTFGKILNGIDWNELLELLATGMNKLRSAIWDFIINLDLPSLTTRIAEAINGLFNNSKVSSSFEESRKKAKKGIDNIITAFENLITGIDWKDISQKIFNGLYNLITKDIQWGRLTGLLNVSIGSLIDIFESLVTSDIIVGLADKLGELIGNVLSKIDFAKLAELAKTGLNKIVVAFSTFTTKINFPKIAVKIAEGINSFFNPNAKINLGTIAGRVSEGVNNIIEGLGKLETGIEWDNVATSISNGLNTMFKETKWGELITIAGNFILDVGESIAQAIAKIDWPYIAGELAKGINGLFIDETTQKVDKSKFEKLGTTIGDALKGILEGIATLLEGIDLGAVVDGIFTFLSSLAWGDILAKILNLLFTFVSKAISALPNVLKGILELITMIDWGQVLVEIINGIFSIGGSVLTAIMETVGGFFSWLFELIFGKSDETSHKISEYFGSPEMFANAGRNAAGMYKKGFQENLTLAEGGDDDAIRKRLAFSAAYIVSEGEDAFLKACKESNVSDEIANELVSQVNDITTTVATTGDWNVVSEKFNYYGMKISDSLAKELTEYGPETVSKAMVLFALGVDSATIEALDLINLDENMQHYMAETGAHVEDIALMLMDEGGREILRTAGFFGEAVGDALGSAVPDATSKALKIGAKQVKDTAEEIAGLADTSANAALMEMNAQHSGEGVVSGLSGAIKDNASDVETATEGVTTPVTEKFEALPDEVKPYAEQLMEYIVTALLDGDDNVKAAIEAVAQAAVDRAREILASNVGLEIGIGFINGIRDGINTQDVTSETAMIASMALSNVTANLNYTNGYRIGQNMVTGLYNGFHSLSQNLVDFIAEVCSVCVESARKILGIASPSKVFAEIGQYTMEGMQIGLEDRGADAIETVSDIANAIIDEAESTDSIGMSLGIMTDGLDVVSDKMLRIANIFSDIADTVVSMGGLEIPTVASGKVLPYHTKVSDFASSTSTNNGSLEDAIYNAFSRAIGSTDAQQEINITLSIDGRKLTDIVTKYQRQQSRALGG